MYIETKIHNAKNTEIATNIKTGTKIVWHLACVNSAVVLITAVAILTLLILQININSDIAATPQHT